MPDQQLGEVLSQALHAGVSHLFKIKNVFEEEKHLILMRGEKKRKNLCSVTRRKKKYATQTALSLTCSLKASNYVLFWC